MELSKIFEQAQYYAGLAEQAQRIADLGMQWQLGVQAAAATAMTPTRNYMQAIASISTPLNTMGLPRVENLVETMRNNISGAGLLNGIGAQWQLGLQSTIATAINPVMGAIQAKMAIYASVFSSQVLESLRQAQKIRFEMMGISQHFIRLQNMLGINLKRFLHEQTAYYQAWLDMREKSDAFTQAFVLCVDKMLWIALRIVRNTEDARDVVQDAYEKAWKKLLSYSVDRIRTLHVEAWLSQIVKTTALNLWRDSRRCGYYEMDWMVQQPGSRFDQPEAHLIRKELLQMVYDSFNALPAIQHKIIFMRYIVADASLQEIADYLARPLGTIKVYHQRGLHALRQQLADRNCPAIDVGELVETLPLWPYIINHSGHQGKECSE